MRRGDIVIVAPPGEFGKPRPAVVVQADVFLEGHASVALCLLTTELVEAPLFRILVEPSRENGLRTISQIQADKVMSVRRERIRDSVGRLDEILLARLNRSLIAFLGLAG